MCKHTKNVRSSQPCISMNFLYWISKAHVFPCVYRYTVCFPVKYFSYFRKYFTYFCMPSIWWNCQNIFLKTFHQTYFTFFSMQSSEMVLNLAYLLLSLIGFIGNTTVVIIYCFKVLQKVNTSFLLVLRLQSFYRA